MTTDHRYRRPGGLSRVVLVCLLAAHTWLFVDLIRHSAFDLGGTTYFTLGDDAMISMRYAANLAAGRGPPPIPARPATTSGITRTASGRSGQG